MTKKKFADAFTLIEMLVVIAIIATLVGLIFAATSGVLEKGKVTQDLNNLRQVGLATQMYLNDNDGAYFLPTGGTVPWMQSLVPKYLPAWRIMQSPFDKRAAVEDNVNAPVSYGFNAQAHGAAATDTLLSDKVTNPSLFVLFAPAQNGASSPTFTGKSGASVTVDKAGGGSQGSALGGTHNKRLRIDACMADLHVENMSWATYMNGDANPPSDPCGKQRWDPLVTCP